MDFPGWLVEPAAKLDPGRFELALVLGGTVSAGAYTAGVVDFLCEALDCMEAERTHGTDLHQVTLKVVTGTSGGAVCAAIAARALNYDWRQEGGVNPFHEIWVNSLTLDKFLTTTDLGKNHLSLLNGDAIDDASNWIERFTAQARPAPRSWVAEPLTTILTVSSLSGVPCTIDFGSGAAQTFVNHADHLRFSISYAHPAAASRPDEFPLTFGPADAPKWTDFSLAARASSAFPLGFPTRNLTRPLEHYTFRVVMIPGVAGAAATPRYIPPDWLQMTGKPYAAANYTFDCVDGGACDNEPIALARAALLGIGQSAERYAGKANRAVMLVDPFAGKVDKPATPETLLDTGSSTLNLFKQQTRYGSADLALAADPNVFSRFMISPQRPGKERATDPDIACGGLGAFMGFACEDFREHDFQLGRLNCQAYLRNHFVLAPLNPVFRPEYAQVRPSTRSDGFLPVIPLFGSADAALPPLPAWPRRRLNPERYRPAIEQRFRKLLASSVDKGFAHLLGILGGFAAEHFVAGKVIERMNRELKDYGLD